jgi:hypothetical protein
VQAHAHAARAVSVLEAGAGKQRIVSRRNVLTTRQELQQQLKLKTLSGGRDGDDVR